MKNVLKLILFLLYTIVIFFISNIWIFITLTMLTFIFYVFYKIPVKKILTYNLFFFVFVALLTLLITLAFNSVTDAIYMFFKLFLIGNATYIFRYTMPTVQFIDTIEKLLSPLKIFHVNTRNIGIIINIAITFIPIFVEEITQIQNSLVQKGLKRNSISSIKYTFVVLIPLLFKRTNEMEYSLKAKCFVE